MSLKSVKAVLFDWDNTLVDSLDLVLNALNHVFCQYDMPKWSMTDVKTKCHISARDAFPMLFKSRYEEALNLFYEFVYANHLKYLQLMPNALDLLQYLKKIHIPMGIVSNKKSSLLRLEIEYLQLTNYFDVIVGSGDIEFDKPRPEPIYFALNKIGLTPSQSILFVGDSPSDWLASKSAGLRTIKIMDDKKQSQSYMFGESILDLLELKNIHY